jgi:serine phosphatase RsbU (regulator of sigma subunit)
LKILHGDKIFFYTDGVTDLPNELGLAYGLPHLRLFLQHNKDKTPSEIGSKLFSDLKNYAGSNKNRDDITMLVMQYSGVQGENKV